MSFKYQRGDTVRMVGMQEWFSYTIERLLIDSDTDARFYAVTHFGGETGLLRPAKLIENDECFFRM